MDPQSREQYLARQLSPGQLQALRIAELAASPISIVLGVLTLYWFIRMRRSFRHDLIMILIQADVFESLWFAIFPLVYYSQGPPNSHSGFCQASGFFLTLGIASADISVLLIAVHTALYVFRGSDGLYPYRWYAYGFLIVVAPILAAVPFASGPNFVNTGEICYLPYRPRWVRQDLSWIPRFIFFGIVMIIYTYIYIHVWIITKKSKTATSGSGGGSSGSGSGSGGRPSDPFGTHHIKGSASYSTPPLAKQGLLLSPPDGTVPTYPPATYQARNTERPNEAPGSGFSQPRSPATAPGDRVRPSSSRQDRYGSHATGQSSFSGLQKQDGEHQVKRSSKPDNLRVNNRDSASTRATPRSRSIAMPMTIWSRVRTFTNRLLRRQPRNPESSEPPQSPVTITSAGTTESHDRLRRQVRIMFMYPLVYAIFWVGPFLAFIFSGNDSRTPFGVEMLSVLSFSLQGASDAIVFICWEKPWRHPKKSSSCRPSSWWRNLPMVHGGRRPGRTREEMMVDGKNARNRRTREIAERQVRRPAPCVVRGNWWDHYEDELRDFELDGEDRSEEQA